MTVGLSSVVNNFDRRVCW